MNNAPDVESPVELLEEEVDLKHAPRAITAAVSQRARGIVREYTAMSAAASFTPIPIADSMAVTGVQLKMLADLSRHYNVPFAQNIAQAMLLATAGGVFNFLLSANPITGALRNFVNTALPLIALPLRLFTGPALVAGYTYILGNAFIRHYEQGGDYHNFNWTDFRHELRRKLGLPPAARSVSPG